MTVWGRGLAMASAITLSATLLPTAAWALPAADAPPLTQPAGVGNLRVTTPGHVRTFIGMARSTTGSWITTSPRGMPEQATTIVVPGTGTPVWGDWDGDGIATPGRYQGGVWTEATQRVGTATLTVGKNYGGVRGDLPITGDWDGDGRTDRGVYRAGVFHWSLTHGGIAVFPFGQDGDQPIVGDWNGDGHTDVGVVRGSLWLLRLAVASPLPPGLTSDATNTTNGLVRALSFNYGTSTDTPVVGDWDGDGVFTPGLVRDARSWYLVRTWATLATPDITTRTIPPGFVPLPVPSPTDYMRGRCPTASPTLVRQQAPLAALVVPPAALIAPVISSTGPNANGWALLRDSLRDEARYLVRSDLTTRLQVHRNRSYIDVLSTDRRTQEYAVRRLGNAAYAVSLARSTGAFTTPNDPLDATPEAPLVDPAVADAYVDWLVRSVACQHVTTSPGGWGRNSQSALWTYVTATAAWYAWARTPAQVRGYIAAMVADEADTVAARPLAYWRDRSGAFTGSPGNTRAEDVSWDAMIVALAASMMPSHPHATVWRTALVQHSVASFASPADLQSLTAVNGIVPARFLQGTNANDDGTVVNHGTLNPDYMAAVAQNWISGFTLRAALQPVPIATLYNGARVYKALRAVSFPTATWPNATAPGGTIYQSNGSIYFPGTVSWGRERRGIWTSTDALARLTHVDADPTIALNAGNYLWLHARDQRLLQARFLDGHSYTEASLEDIYPGGREEYNAQQLAAGYWARAVNDSIPLRRDVRAYSQAPPL
ncbi:MAG: VCBS repeat-containing protein [Actinomycetes bacterium]